MYVLNYAQNENIMDYLKEILENNNKKNLINKADNSDNKNSLIEDLEESKYIHLIIKNPNNKKETFELGLKIVDIASNSRY